MRKNRKLERDIERSIVNYVENGLGGKALKLRISGKNGYPDRTCFLPGGQLIIFETKCPGEHPEPIQKVMIRELRELGFNTHVVHSLEEAKRHIGKLMKEKPLEIIRT